ncbi:hypothetical protein VTN00DRAFT_3582 [Thermoascus crustaceus]|uniref:uncharacterized protein n=1 Tax=Thermoascus crustaceus TaxID=5088 RepID=UPI0037424C72
MIQGEETAVRPVHDRTHGRRKKTTRKQETRAMWWSANTRVDVLLVKWPKKYSKMPWRTGTGKETERASIGNSRQLTQGREPEIGRIDDGKRTGTRFNPVRTGTDHRTPFQARS